MGLFDSLFKKEQSNSTPIFVAENENSACVALMYACMNADGEPSQVETDNILRTLIFKKWFIADEIVPYIKKVLYALREGSIRDLIDGACSLISENRKPTIFALCCDVFFADGVLEENEKNIAEYIADKLNLDKDLAQKIMEVMILKNRDNRILND